MKITKIFTAEGSHIVRNCTSKRCSHSVHGHSYKIELEFEATNLDHAQMVMDFGLMKGCIKDLVDSMDHCHIISDKESPEYIEFFKKYNDRYIIVPFNASAEMLSIWILKMVNDLVEDIKFNNGESGVKAVGCTVWETTTGRAHATVEDFKFLPDDLWLRTEFSQGVIGEWGNDLVDWYYGDTVIEFPVIPQQIKL